MNSLSIICCPRFAGIFMKKTWCILALIMCCLPAFPASTTLIYQNPVYPISSSAQPGVSRYVWSVPLIVRYEWAQGGKGNVRCYTGTAPDSTVHPWGDSPDWTLPSSLRFNTISAQMGGEFINDIIYSTTDIEATKTLGDMRVTMDVDSSFNSGKSDNDLYLTCAAGLVQGSGAAHYYNTVYRFMLPSVTASISAQDLSLGSCKAGSGSLLKEHLPVTVSSQYINGRLKWSSIQDATALVFNAGQSTMTENTWHSYQSSPVDIFVSVKCPEKPGQYTWPITLTWEVE
jgi:hypothetical protein